MSWLRGWCFVTASSIGCGSSAPPPVLSNAPPSGAHIAEDCRPAVTLVDTSGKAYSRETLDGKVVVVNFFATWAKASPREIEMLSAFAHQYPDADVVFLGVLAENVSEERRLDYIEKTMMLYPVILGTPEIMTAYDHPSALPTTFVYDRQGKRAVHHVGAYQPRDLIVLLDTLVAARTAEPIATSRPPCSVQAR